MPQGKGTYGSKKGRPPKKMNRGGMSTGVSRSRMTPSQKRAAMRGPKKSGVAEIQEGLGQTRPGMKKGGKVKKMNTGGAMSTQMPQQGGRTMSPTPRAATPLTPTNIAQGGLSSYRRPPPMPQESRVRVRPGMKKGGTVAMPKMMARGGALAKAERKALGGVRSVGSEVYKKSK